MIDINVSYGNWPFLPVGYESFDALMDHLESCEIQKAMISHLGAVWDPDVHKYNHVLIKASMQRTGAIPIPVVNPAWPSAIDYYHNEVDLVGIRVYPSYHGYALDDPIMEGLAGYLLEQERPLFIQMRLEDERMQHPSARVGSVKTDEILHLHARYPSLQIICLNAYLPEVRYIASQSQRIGFDTAFCEWLFSIESMLDVLPAEQIFLGTHSPFLYTQAGILKVSASRVSESIKKCIAVDNARRLIDLTDIES